MSGADELWLTGE